MKNRKIEKQLASEIKEITPNVLSDVLANIKVNKQPKQSFSDKFNTYFRQNLARVTAGAMVLLFLIFGAFTLYNNINQTYAVIALDVNPSIELKLNSKNKVVSVTTNNEDARIIIADMNLEKVDLNVAIYALIGSMVSKGYIDEARNSILLSVEAKDNQVEKALKQQLNQTINNVLATTTFEGSVITQSLETNNTVESIVQSLNISRAKASIIYRLIEIDPSMTAQSLALLSINDLNLLINAKNLNLLGVSVSGNASKMLYITAEDALNVAILHAGVNINDIISSSVELDEEDGLMVYDVEIETLNSEHEYTINATNGSIIEFQVDEDENENDYNVPDNAITQSQALQIAITHSGYSIIDVLEFSVEFEVDEPLYIYTINFETQNDEYEYEINAITGTIISYS